MKAQIHPKWYPAAHVKCACGNEFTIGATVPEIEVEVCSVCHPFYTGQMKFVDTAGRVEAFRAKQKGANKKALSKGERRKIKRQKRIKDEYSRPESLSELRTQEKSDKK
jgi:large subunit ribosomal protein L31